MLHVTMETEWETTVAGKQSNTIKLCHFSRWPVLKISHFQAIVSWPITSLLCTISALIPEWLGIHLSLIALSGEQSLPLWKQYKWHYGNPPMKSRQFTVASQTSSKRTEIEVFLNYSMSFCFLVLFCFLIIVRRAIATYFWWVLMITNTCIYSVL